MAFLFSINFFPVHLFVYFLYDYLERLLVGTRVHACDRDRRLHVTNDVTNFKMADSIVCNEKSLTDYFGGKLCG